MLIGRASELNYLNNCYIREGSRIVVVYGKKHIGKTALLKEFLTGKEGHYYLARACSEREHLYQWGRQLAEENTLEHTPETYRDILQTAVGERQQKQVLVIDEFQNLVRAGSGFMKELAAFVREQERTPEILVILSSSSIGWVENSMVTRIGEAAYELSGFLKIRELSFNCMREFFKAFDIEQSVEAYAILGGIPGLWQHFDDRRSIHENICKAILRDESLLCEEGERLVSEQLREPAVYNTILASMAAGNHKLNELYLHTGFSRAKISVYLKSLMELEVVEKVFSYDTEGRENVQKGIYRICHPLVSFYFTYLYPHMSAKATLSGERFYERYIRPDFRRFVSDCFRQICVQNLECRNENGELPLHLENTGEWVGKQGTIDIVAQDEQGRTLIALCNWRNRTMTYENYESLLELAQKARIKADYIYLYTATGFDERLLAKARAEKDLRLIRLTDL